MGRAPVGPARTAREYSGDIKLCINEFYELAGRHSLALTARCGSSEAFLFEIDKQVGNLMYNVHKRSAMRSNRIRTDGYDFETENS